jgi:hypothetical protein
MSCSAVIYHSYQVLCFLVSLISVFHCNTDHVPLLIVLSWICYQRFSCGDCCAILLLKGSLAIRIVLPCVSCKFHMYFILDHPVFYCVFLLQFILCFLTTPTRLSCSSCYAIVPSWWVLLRFVLHYIVIPTSFTFCSFCAILYSLAVCFALHHNSYQLFCGTCCAILHSFWSLLLHVQCNLVIPSSVLLLTVCYY